MSVYVCLVASLYSRAWFCGAKNWLEKVIFVLGRSFGLAKHESSSFACPDALINR